MTEEKQAGVCEIKQTILSKGEIETIVADVDKQHWTDALVNSNKSKLTDKVSIAYLGQDDNIIGGTFAMGEMDEDGNGCIVLYMPIHKSEEEFYLRTILTDNHGADKLKLFISGNTVMVFAIHDEDKLTMAGLGKILQVIDTGHFAKVTDVVVHIDPEVDCSDSPVDMLSNVGFLVDNDEEYHFFTGKSTASSDNHGFELSENVLQFPKADMAEKHSLIVVTFKNGAKFCLAYRIFKDHIVTADGTKFDDDQEVLVVIDDNSQPYTINMTEAATDTGHPFYELSCNVSRMFNLDVAMAEEEGDVPAEEVSEEVEVDGEG